MTKTVGNNLNRLNKPTISLVTLKKGEFTTKVSETNFILFAQITSQMTLSKINIIKIRFKMKNKRKSQLCIFYNKP